MWAAHPAPPGAAGARKFALPRALCPRKTVNGGLMSHLASARARRAALMICLGICAGLGAPAAGVAKASPSRPGLFYVGAAKEDVTPTDLTSFYLGGYGIGPVHKATSVLRHIYFRVIA